MDPNEALARLREYFAIDPDNDPETVLDGFDDAKQYFDALDGWLKSGGYKPHDWDRVKLPGS